MATDRNRRYAAGTSVAPSSTRAEIERTLARYGATGFAYGYQSDVHMIMFEHGGYRVRFVLRLPPVDDPAFTRTTTGRQRTATQAREQYDQAVRAAWRALLLVIKAKLESVELGVEEFVEAFATQIVLPDGSTVGQWLTPQIDAAYQTGTMPPLLPGVGGDRPALPPGSGE